MSRKEDFAVISVPRGITEDYFRNNYPDLNALLSNRREDVEESEANEEELPNSTKENLSIPG